MTIEKNVKHRNFIIIRELFKHKDKHLTASTHIMLVRLKMEFRMDKALNIKALISIVVGVRVGKEVFA